MYTHTHIHVKYVYVCLMFLFLLVFVFLFSVFLGLHLQHVEVPRLGVRLELQLPAYAMATAMLDPSCICDLHHSSLDP